MKRLAVLATLSFFCACGGDAPAPTTPVAPIVFPSASASVRTFSESPEIDSTAKLSGIDDLVAAFADAPPDQRASLLQQIRDEFGGTGLVAALDAKPKSPDAEHAYEREKQRTREVMAALAAFVDPRAADALAAYVDRATNPHWKFEAAVRLAEMGDLRAAAALGARLGQDPLKLYRADLDPEYRRDDTERIVAARMLAELAAMYPNARADLRAAAEAQTIQWLTGSPEPHANGLRFLATAESSAILPRLRAWAQPKDPLPAAGAAMFPPSFATAQSALRYLGKTKDPSAFGILENALHRRPGNVDATMDALLSGGNAVQGMALRALGVGAAMGFAELGDSRAVPLLEKYIADPKENEQARFEACQALAWVATDKNLEEIANRAVAEIRKVEGSSKSPVSSLCYLETLARKTTPAASTIVFNAFFHASANAELRSAAAVALGLNGVPDALEPKLTAMLSDAQLQDDAALALLLGGPPDSARKALSSYSNDADNLKVKYHRALSFFSDAAYARGDIARWATNAAACREQWPRAIVANTLSQISFDAGPHTLTRHMFRHLLIQDAHAMKEPEHTKAGLLLLLSKEEGIIASLNESLQIQPKTNP